MSAHLGIAVASGMLKGVFGHGVLSAFEEAGIRASAYGVASSSGLSGGMAAIGQARAVGVEYWKQAAAGARERSMSEVVLNSIAEYGPRLRAGLFSPGAPRFLMAASRVTTEEAAAQTQGPQARELGKELLKNVFTGDRGWVVDNLAAHVFDSTAPEGRPALTEENFDEVAYASTRMLHAWEIPATIDGAPYVDASYTCSCPAREVAETGCPVVVAIGSDPWPLFRDLYASEEITEEQSPENGPQVLIVKPPVDLKTLGVDYAAASDSAMLVCYELGMETGKRFLDEHGDLLHPVGDGAR